MDALGVKKEEYWAMRAFFGDKWPSDLSELSELSEANASQLGHLYADFAVGQILGLSQYADLTSKDAKELRGAIVKAQGGDKRALLEVTSSASFVKFAATTKVGAGALDGLFRDGATRSTIAEGAKLAGLLEVARGRANLPGQVGSATAEAATILGVDAQKAAELGDIAAALAVKREDAGALARLEGLNVDARTLQKLGLVADPVEEAHKRDEAARTAEAERVKKEEEEKAKKARDEADAAAKAAKTKKESGVFGLSDKPLSKLKNAISDINQSISNMKSKIGNPTDGIEHNWNSYIDARTRLLAAAGEVLPKDDLHAIAGRIPENKDDLFLERGVSVFVKNNELAVKPELPVLGDHMKELERRGRDLEIAAALDMQHQVEVQKEKGEKGVDVDGMIQKIRENATGDQLLKQRQARVAALKSYMAEVSNIQQTLGETRGLESQASRFEGILSKLTEQEDISRLYTELEKEKGAIPTFSWRDIPVLGYVVPGVEINRVTREEHLDKIGKGKDARSHPDDHELFTKMRVGDKAPPPEQEPSGGASGDQSGGAPSSEPDPSPNAANPEMPPNAGANQGTSPNAGAKSGPAPPPEAKPSVEPEQPKAQGPGTAPNAGLFASVSEAANAAAGAAFAAVAGVSDAAKAAADALGSAAETARIFVAPTEEDLLRRDVAGNPEILDVLNGLKGTKGKPEETNRILDRARALAKAKGIEVTPFWRGKVALAPWVSEADARETGERQRALPRVIASTAVPARVLVIGEYRGKPTARGVIAAHGAVATCAARQEKTFWRELKTELARAYAPMVVAPLAAVFVAEDAVDAGASLAVGLLAASGVAMVRLAAHCSDAPPDGSMHALGAFAAGGEVYVLSARDARRAIAHPFHKRRVERRASRAARDAYAAEVRRATNWAAALDTLVDVVATKGI
jgi:hypothetical protein